MVPEVPVTQCAAVITRSPAGLSTTLAVQKCWPSRPADVVNSAPTAGWPENDWPFFEGAARCPTARTKPVARSLAAPLAGVSVTTAPTATAVIAADLEGDRKTVLARLRGPRRPIWNCTCPDHLPNPVRNRQFCTVLDIRSILNCDRQGATVPEAKPAKLVRSQHPTWDS